MQVKRLPWWTWFLPLPIFHLGTQLSLQFQIAPGTSIWYLPIPFALVLVHWWGPRVLPALWLNAALCAGLWGLERRELFPLYALPETVIVLLSWLFVRWTGVRMHMPDTRHLVLGIVLGVLLPLVIGDLYLVGQLFALGDIARTDLTGLFRAQLVSDFLGGLAVAVPFLMLATRAMVSRGLAPALPEETTIAVVPERLAVRHVVELGLIGVASWAILAVVGQDNGMALLGITGLWAATRFRLLGALVHNAWLVFIALLLPSLSHPPSSADLTDLHITLGTLLVSALLVARALLTADDRLAERDRLAQHLRLEQEGLRTTLESIGDAVIATDHAGMVVRMNPVAEQLTGWTAADAKGRPLDEVFVICNARTRKPSPSPVARVLGSGAIVGLANHTVLLARDGREIHIADSGAPIRSAAGAVVGVVLVFRDVGDAERARELAAHHAKLESLGHLAGGVAHDFNNLLAAIISASELLDRHVGQGERERRLLGTIASAAHRGADLTRQLLTFARKSPIAEDRVDVTTCLRESAALLERLVERRITIVVEASSEPLVVLGDRSQILNALLNLGINARDAITGSGRITLRSARIMLTGDDALARGLPPGAYVLIEVIDDGTGIPADVLPRIFDPFFTTKSTGKGTGLGLAAVFGIARTHHGVVSVALTGPGGTCFALHLPLSDALPLPSAGRQVELNSCCVLLVDDDEQVREALELLLISAGCTVESLGDGAQAIARLQRDPLPDLALLDLDMPAPGGVEICRSVRVRNGGLAILMMSGHGGGQDLSALLAQPRTGFIGKPFTLEALAGAVRRIAPELTS